MCTSLPISCHGLCANASFDAGSYLTIPSSATFTEDFFPTLFSRVLMSSVACQRQKEAMRCTHSGIGKWTAWFTILIMTPWSMLMMDTRLLNLKGVRPLDFNKLWIPRALQICEPHAASLNWTFMNFLGATSHLLSGVKVVNLSLTIVHSKNNYVLKTRRAVAHLSSLHDTTQGLPQGNRIGGRRSAVLIARSQEECMTRSEGTRP
jgi:hypothetical protein